MEKRIIDKLILRKLTEKSVLDCIDNTLIVQDLINMKKFNELAHIYYHMEKISFSDSVLQLLGIVDKYVISKPGTDPNKYEKYLKRK